MQNQFNSRHTREGATSWVPVLSKSDSTKTVLRKTAAPKTPALQTPTALNVPFQLAQREMRASHVAFNVKAPNNFRCTCQTGNQGCQKVIADDGSKCETQNAQLYLRRFLQHKYFPLALLIVNMYSCRKSARSYGRRFNSSD